MARAFVPERGDLIWISLEQQPGHEQSIRRPALVVSPSAYNRKVGLGILCPIASQVKGYPFEVSLPAGLSVGGVILADQVQSFDWRARRAQLIAVLPAVVVDEVLLKVRALL
jgi:mRNA interferase MazF